MTNYNLMYHLGITPWERYASAAATTIAALLDREEDGRLSPPGRALDLGCGRGQHTSELARRGWQTVGVDNVPAAIAAARKRNGDGATFVIADVTDLLAAQLGSFDFFLDIGCFQGLNLDQQQALGRGVTALANPGATMLVLAFGPTRMWSFLGAASRRDFETALTNWDILTVQPADTASLGWPMNRTTPQWYRLRRIHPA